MELLHIDAVWWLHSLWWIFMLFWYLCQPLLFIRVSIFIFIRYLTFGITLLNFSNLSTSVMANVIGICFRCLITADVKYSVVQTFQIIWKGNYFQLFYFSRPNFILFFFRFMTRLGTDYRLDAGLIALSICELIIAVISATVSSKTLCGTPKVKFVYSYFLIILDTLSIFALFIKVMKYN